MQTARLRFLLLLGLPLAASVQAESIQFDFAQQTQWENHFEVVTPGTHLTWHSGGYIEGRQGTSYFGAALYSPGSSEEPADTFLTETLEARVSWNVLNIQPGFGFNMRVDPETGAAVHARVHTPDSKSLRLYLTAGRNVSELTGGTMFFDVDLDLQAGTAAYNVGSGGASATSGRELTPGEPLVVRLEQTGDDEPRFCLTVTDGAGVILGSTGFQTLAGVADFSGPGAVGFFSLAGGSGAQAVRIEQFAILDTAPDVRRMRTSGVVSYSDMAHMFIVDYKDFDGFYGLGGARYVVDQPKRYGMSRVYWRVFAGSSVYHDSRIDLDEDGVPDVIVQDQYHHNMPPSGSTANDPGHFRLHAGVRLGELRLKPERFREPPVTLELRIRTENLVGNPDAGQYAIRYGDGAGSEWSLYLMGDGSLTNEGAAQRVNFRYKEYYYYVRLVCEPEGVTAYVNHDPATALPLVRQDSTNTGFSIHKIANANIAIRVDSLMMTSGAHPPPAKFPYEEWDLLRSNYGPRADWHQVAWSEDWENVSGFTVSQSAGSEHRRLDLRTAYRDDPELFGPGRDVLSEVMEYGRKQKRKMYAWLSLCEENHYGNGPFSRFVTLNPQYREVDRMGRVWRGRLSFAYPEVRAYKLAMIRELVERYGVDGILLDFARRGLLDPYLEQTGQLHHSVRDGSGVSIMGYDARSRAEYQSVYGVDPQSISNGTQNWIQFRADYWTQFLREVRDEFPDLQVVAMVFSYSDTVARRQDLLDWGRWVDEGLVDEMAFLIDNSTDGRPFLNPFGGQPEPLESVYTVIRDRKERIGDKAGVIAAVYGYRITASQVESITSYAYEAGADEIMWWETVPLEWADYSGSVWREVGRLADLYANYTDPFDRWRNFHFGEFFSEETVSGPLADPAGDAIPNLLKYVLGLDPLALAGPGDLPEVRNLPDVDGEDRLELKYRRPAGLDGITCTVEVSDDLKNWRSGPDVTATVSIEPAADGREEITVREYDEAGPDNRRFIRLRVER